jgi:hypothetical protein
MKVNLTGCEILQLEAKSRPFDTVTVCICIISIKNLKMGTIFYIDLEADFHLLLRHVVFNANIRLLTEKMLRCLKKLLTGLVICPTV